jgi:hypothetical protein
MPPRAANPPDRVNAKSVPLLYKKNRRRKMLCVEKKRGLREAKKGGKNTVDAVKP